MLKIQHALPVLLLTGCAGRQPFPATWRLAGRTLMPPGVAADLAQRRFTTPIPGRSRCPESDAIVLQPRRSRLTVTVRRDALLARPRGWLTTWTEQAESEGCIAPGQGAVLAARIVESIALPSGADLRLLRVDGMPNYVEIGAGNRLQVISPILREGANPEAPLFDASKVSAEGGGLTVELKSGPDAILDLKPRGTTFARKPADAGSRLSRRPPKPVSRARGKASPRRRGTTSSRSRRWVSTACFTRRTRAKSWRRPARARRCPPIRMPAIGRADLFVWRFRAVSESILICW